MILINYSGTEQLYLFVVVVVVVVIVMLLLFILFIIHLFIFTQILTRHTLCTHFRFCECKCCLGWSFVLQTRPDVSIYDTWQRHDKRSYVQLIIARLPAPTGTLKTKRSSVEMICLLWWIWRLLTIPLDLGVLARRKWSKIIAKHALDSGKRKDRMNEWNGPCVAKCQLSHSLSKVAIRFTS